VLLQARSCVEALRLRAQRLAVVRRGRLVARSPANAAQLLLAGRPARVDYTLQSGTTG
ncbi:MAG: hypothetical protein RLY71_2501, partial [Pseudomonadota bacterium]|jgi:cytosine deaminase